MINYDGEVTNNVFMVALKMRNFIMPLGLIPMLKLGI